MTIWHTRRRKTISGGAAAGTVAVVAAIGLAVPASAYQEFQIFENTCNSDGQDCDTGVYTTAVKMNPAGISVGFVSSPDMCSDIIAKISIEMPNRTKSGKAGCHRVTGHRSLPFRPALPTTPATSASRSTPSVLREVATPAAFSNGQASSLLRTAGIRFLRHSQPILQRDRSTTFAARGQRLRRGSNDRRRARIPVAGIESDEWPLDSAAVNQIRKAHQQARQPKRKSDDYPAHP